MVDRIISLLMITVIVICPVRCADGRCSESHACGQAARTAVGADAGGAHPAQGTPCHGSCATEQHHDVDPLNGGDPRRDEKKPACPCSEDSPCQCVCAGAVFDRGVLPHGSVCPTPAINVTPHLDGDFCRPVPVPTHERGGTQRGNYGRSLRTLHASFLC